MEDIIQKLQQKDRRFKVTVKKKFVDDALYNSTSIRVASVYVIVVNREKTYDPNLNQKAFKSRKKIANGSLVVESSSEEEESQLTKDKSEDFKQHEVRRGGGKDLIRRSANPNMITAGKKSLYESDNAMGEAPTSANSNMPNFRRLGSENKDDKLKGEKNASVPRFKRVQKKDDENSMPYKYQ